jgi:very-short-patch-repair endonuclease
MKLENDSTVESFHEAAANSRIRLFQTNDNIDGHFVTFTCVNDKLYELDGRLEGPICHQRTSRLDFLKDACGVIKEWMEADKDELRFTILALASAEIK